MQHSKIFLAFLHKFFTRANNAFDLLIFGISVWQKGYTSMLFCNLFCLRRLLHYSFPPDALFFGDKPQNLRSHDPETNALPLK